MQSVLCAWLWATNPWLTRTYKNRPTTPLGVTMSVLYSATPAFKEPTRKLEWSRINNGPATPRNMWKTNQPLSLPQLRANLRCLRSGYTNRICHHGGTGHAKPIADIIAGSEQACL